MTRNASVLLLASLTGAALAGATAAAWMNQGGAIFLAYVDAGLSWCL